MKRDYLPISDCKNGYLYRIGSRNLDLGVFRAEAKGFIGIREKFGHEFLFTEFHYDTGAPFGTAFPYEELALCPITDLRESHEIDGRLHDNEVLFRWMKGQEKKYGSYISALSSLIHYDSDVIFLVSNACGEFGGSLSDLFEPDDNVDIDDDEAVLTALLRRYHL